MPGWHQSVYTQQPDDTSWGQRDVDDIHSGAGCENLHFPHREAICWNPGTMLGIVKGLTLW